MGRMTRWAVELVFPSLATTVDGQLALRTVIRPDGDGYYDNLTDSNNKNIWGTWYEARHCQIAGEKK